MNGFKMSIKKVVAGVGALAVLAAVAFGAVWLDRSFFRQDEPDWVYPSFAAVSVSVFPEAESLINPVAQTFIDSKDCDVAEFYEQNVGEQRVDIGNPVKLS